MTCPRGFHPPVAAKRLNHTLDFHTKSYSYRFECPTCGKSRRYNTNFLGNRYHLVCDGSKITRRVKNEPIEYVVVVGSDRGAKESTVRVSL